MSRFFPETSPGVDVLVITNIVRIRREQRLIQKRTMHCIGDSNEISILQVVGTYRQAEGLKEVQPSCRDFKLMLRNPSVSISNRDILSFEKGKKGGVVVIVLSGSRARRYIALVARMKITQKSNLSDEA